MFKQLNIYLFFIALPFVLLLVGASIFFDAIKLTITRNPHPQINYTIFAIILVGGILVLLNAKRLLREARNIVEFFGAVRAKGDASKVQDLANSYSGETACLLQMVATSGGRAISHQEQVAIEHELSNTRTSLLRRNALPQYLTGLLVGMGLLGTFIGLLATLNDITVLISSFADLDMQNASPLVVFRTMIDRMRAPMTSMGIAFSASMFGLLGSIILGLMMVGIRRLQGDMFSFLSSEVARHIEIALSYEKVSSRGGVELNGDIGDVAKVLLRIEERFAEASRLQQRTLTAVVDDFQKQRAEMLRTLGAQTEASNGFRSELQQLGGQLNNIFTGMEKSRGEISNQLSDLTVRLAGDARETHKLLGMQVDEQKRLQDKLDSFNIDERLDENSRRQQRMLTTVIEDFQQQRADMQRTLTEQTEASTAFRQELKLLGERLDSIFAGMEKGNGEISGQLSELTVNLAADGKETHMLLTGATNTFRHELQQLGGQLGSGLQESRETVDARLTELIGQVADSGRKTSGQVETSAELLRDEVRQLQAQLLAGIEKGNGELDSRLVALTEQVAADARAAAGRFDAAGNAFRQELQQLAGQLETLAVEAKKGDGEICTQIAALTSQVGAEAKEARRNFDRASDGFQRELQQLGGQLAGISSGLEKGNGEICTQISELIGQGIEMDKKPEETLAVNVD